MITGKDSGKMGDTAEKFSAKTPKGASLPDRVKKDKRV